MGLYRSNDLAAEQLRIDLEAAGSKSSLLFKCDITQDNEPIWDRIRSSMTQNLVLVNNAFSPFQPQPFHKLKWEDFEAAFGAGIKGSWISTSALLRAMVKNRDGTIVNVLSTATHGLPPKGFGAYVTAKHAQRGLTLALASEYSHLGLRIFSVSPGFMATALTDRWDPKILAAIASGLRPGDPKDVARKIVALTESASTPGRGEDYLV
jgi:NAD(P)-dependent dehydrogenase (short-subunit alcohol dehydrogenase family)